MTTVRNPGFVSHNEAVMEPLPLSMQAEIVTMRVAELIGFHSVLHQTSTV